MLLVSHFRLLLPHPKVLQWDRLLKTGKVIPILLILILGEIYPITLLSTMLGCNMANFNELNTPIEEPIEYSYPRECVENVLVNFHSLLTNHDRDRSTAQKV